MVKVLDASALLAYLWKEPSYGKVKELLTKAAESKQKLLMSAANWGEVYYVLARDHSMDEVEEFMRLIETFPIEVVPVDSLIAKQAAQYKSQKKLPYVDCFAAALAKLKKGELVTGDREFKAVENEIKIIWI